MSCDFQYTGIMNTKLIRSLSNSFKIKQEVEFDKNNLNEIIRDPVGSYVC